MSLSLKKEITEDEQKIISDKIKIWYVGWNKKWLNSGSYFGFPTNTNKMWMEYTGGNVSKAKKTYYAELLGRFAILNITWGVLEFLRDFTFYGVSFIGSDKVKACTTNINNLYSTNEDFKTKWDEGTITKKDLPDPCSDFGVLWGVQFELSESWGGYLVEKILPSLEFSMDQVTDLFPGKWDDIVANVISFLNFSKDRGSVEEFIESVNDAKDRVEAEAQNEANQINDGEFDNSQNGFKEFLRKNEIDEENLSGTKDTFMNGGLTFTFVITNNSNKKGTFHVKE
jgi:hypothetical protein